MFELQTKENQEQFSAAVETLKEELFSKFTDGEKKNSTLALYRIFGYPQDRVDLLSELDPEKLLYYVKNNSDITYRLVIEKIPGFVKRKKEEIEIAHFKLVEMPGCCGVVISTAAWTEPKFRQRGIGTVMNKFRMAIARAVGYSTMMCTAVDDGITEKILAKNGWSKIGGFVNRRTNNSISMYSVMLPVIAEKKA
jgi:hypothetical protein